MSRLIGVDNCIHVIAWETVAVPCVALSITAYGSQKGPVSLVRSRPGYSAHGLPLFCKGSVF